MNTRAHRQIVPQTSQPHWPALRDDGFPTSCPDGARNCVRLGNGTDVYAAGKSTDMVAPQLGGSSSQVINSIEAWVRGEGGVIVFRSDRVVRAIFTTLLMGYRDDFAALVFCDETAHSVANFQSQSRLGIGDMGTNAARLARLLDVLKGVCPVDPVDRPGIRIDEMGRRSWEGSAKPSLLSTASDRPCDAKCMG
jgi:uncharacterized protein (DUF1499 family)